MIDIGKRIKKRRLELNWTQEELASRMGYKTKSTINKIECGKNDVTQSNIIKFADVLGVSVAHLMGYENESSNEASDNNVIGKTLKSLRTKRKLSMVELAEEMHITVDDLMEYEKGTKKIPLEILIKFAHFFDVDIEKLQGVNLFRQGETAFVSTDERQVELHKRWNESVGQIDFTDKEHDLLILVADFIKSIRNRKDYDEILDTAFVLIKQLKK